MPAVVDSDFSIATNGDIRYTGDAHGGASPAYNTVIEFHRWLGDKMDDALAVGDDLLDITDATASERQTDNIIVLKPPYNIDDTTAEHLFDGSIVQGTGVTEEIYDGMLVLANAGMHLEIVQDGALVTPNFWTTGLNADATNGISHRFMLKVRTAGADIDGRRILGQTREFGFTYSEFRVNGTARGNNVLALTYANDLNNENTAATVSGWTDIVNIEGFRSIDVDGDTTPENYYSEWDKGSRTINQFYERMKWLTRRGTTSTLYGSTGTKLNGELFRGITHEVNLTGATTGTFDATEYVSWGTGGSAGTGVMVAIDSVTAGTKMWIQLQTGVAPSASVTITGGNSAAFVSNTGTPTDRTLSFPFIGQSTGSAIIGAYGVGIEAADLTASDKLFDLTNTQRTPPNNVTFTVNGLVSGEDRVLVAPLGYEFAYDNEGGAAGAFTLGETLTFTAPAGTAYLSFLRDDGLTGRMQVRMLSGDVPVDNSTITGGTSGRTAIVNGAVSASEDPRQLILTAVALSGTGVTTVPCTTAIPTDTPSAAGTTGSIRIKLASGVFRHIAYTSYSGNDFTIPSTDFSADNAPASTSIFIGYIDKDITGGATSASFTGVYSADRSLFVRVRDGGSTPIKTFETTGTLGSAGGSTTAIRTSDA